MRNDNIAVRMESKEVLIFRMRKMLYLIDMRDKYTRMTVKCRDTAKIRHLLYQLICIHVTGSYLPHSPL